MPPKINKVGRPPGSKNKIKNKIDDVSEACEFCKEVYDSPKQYKAHLQYCKTSVLQSAQKRDTTYNCSKCNKKFKLKINFKNHLKNEHSRTPGSIKCKQCFVVCPNDEVLTRHVELIHQREIFECEHCGTKFVRRSHVARHMKQKGCDGKNVNLFPCEICDASFTRKDNLMVHLRLQHISRLDYSCKHCEFSTKNFSKLILHTQKFHIENLQLECDYCGKMTGSRAAMTKHLEIHGEKKYACDVCGYNTYTIEVMRRHVLTHVPDKPHKCPLCERSYIQKVQLQRHMKNHSGHCCTTCGDTFKTEAKLIIHKNQHRTNGLSCPFVDCEFSKKGFKNQDSLEEHLKLHYEPFKCEVCNKRFQNETNMRRHLSTHALEKPRRCMYCVRARAYARGEHLIRHVRKSHPKVFRERLEHVRRVLGSVVSVERVCKSEIESILNVLDAESERIISGYGEGVLYGGLREMSPGEEAAREEELQEEESPLMSEEELAQSLRKLLMQLIDKEMLECFGWPDESIDVVLEKVIENCGARAADRDKWTLVQRLRENAKHLFLYVIEDKDIARMMDTHTIDQIIKHILQQVSDEDEQNAAELTQAS
ncbi:zinc finger protein draculin [Bicyclus anynana]|uniref:Zinc finger protein draculin n=1 Tax=Bicyclus anynana TaxID=110368 RepID=A0A6J1MT57_BICAN|nr:zinc finger protein draculin [Bicyclus anynana]